MTDKSIDLLDFVKGLGKLCRESTHPDSQVREQLGHVAGLIDGALAKEEARAAIDSKVERIHTLFEPLYEHARKCCGDTNIIAQVEQMVTDQKLKWIIGVRNRETGQIIPCDNGHVKNGITPGWEPIYEQNSLTGRITSYLAYNDSITLEQLSDLLRDCRRFIEDADKLFARWANEQM